jgi:hypothetical protein
MSLARSGSEMGEQRLRILIAIVISELPLHLAALFQDNECVAPV